MLCYVPVSLVWVLALGVTAGPPPLQSDSQLTRKELPQFDESVDHEDGGQQEPVIVEMPVSSKGLVRRKRSWIVPPISFPENDRGPFPKRLAQVRSDNDKGVKILYSITGQGVELPPTGLFTIDRYSGMIFVNRPMDRERGDQHQLKLHAVAEGGGAAEEPMNIVINVIDQNDNKPEFMRDPFLGSVPEASPKGFPIMNISATDRDQPGSPNSDVRYSIVGQEPPLPRPDMFAINPVTGEIRVNNAALDRKNFPKYTLEVQSADMAGEGLATTGKAIITVTDSNDNAPQLNVVTVITTAKALNFEREPHTLRVTVDIDIPFTAGLLTSTATVRVHVRDKDEVSVLPPLEKVVSIPVD